MNRDAGTTTTTRKRRPYSPPELSIHGNVTEVTKAVGVRGAKDGGNGKTQKTG
jgi:hypothetical protein